MTRLSWLAAAFVLVVASGWARGVQAQEADTDTRARQLFRVGQAHYENGQFAEAAAEFEEAYRLSHRSRLLYNAYLAYRDMQDLPNAARTLRQFIEETADLEESERDQLRARLAAIDSALARGSHEMTDDDTQTSATTSTSSTSASSAAPATEPAGGGFHPSPVGFVVGGVGLALGVAAIITGALSSSDYGTLSSACSNGVCPDRPDLRDAQSRGQMLAALTDAFWITGVVAVGVGVALIFALQDGGEEPATTADVGCGPSGCYGVVRTRF